MLTFSYTVLRRCVAHYIFLVDSLCLIIGTSGMAVCLRRQLTVRIYGTGGP